MTKPLLEVADVFRSLGPEFLETEGRTLSPEQRRVVREAAGSVIQPRSLILVERNARAAVIVSYVTLAEDRPYWTNAVTEVAVAQNSWLEHTRIQRESEAAYHIGSTHVDQQRDSHYRSFTMAMLALDP